MDKELFYEIILFAEERGYKWHLGMLPVMPICPTSATSLAKTIFWGHKYEIIFNHDFAKAFWGDNSTHEATGEDWGKPKHEIYGSIPAWYFHIKAMVVQKDPFEYLEKKYKRIK